MIVDAAETVLGYFGFDRTIYENKKNKVTRKWGWLEELRQEREKDIEVETMETTKTMAKIIEIRDMFALLIANKLSSLLL